MSNVQEKIIADIKAKGGFVSQEDMERARKAWDKIDVAITYSGRAISLPAIPDDMPLDKAIDALQRILKDQNQDFTVHELFDAYPHDACVAFVKAMTKLYGFATFQTEQTFFGPKPPQMLSIKTGFRENDILLCPMGELRLPGVDQPIKTQFWRRSPSDPTQFLVSGTIKKKDRHIVAELAAEARKILKEESIYRGKPLLIRVNEDGQLDTNMPPEFLDVQEIRPEHLFFDDEVHDQIQTSILVPIMHATACRKQGIQAKRTIVLSGPYGTGKSLTGRLVAKVGEDHGWTYILLDKVKGLKVALEFAKRYSPAIVFAEDIERVAGVERTDDVNDLINIVDGVVSKTSEIITVLTTNHLNQINKAMLRPGRLDAVVQIDAPGPKTAERIMRFYGGELLHTDEDLGEAGFALRGQIPATIREAVQRAALGMIGRGDNKLIGHDIVIAKQTMDVQLNALNLGTPTETTAEVLQRGLAGVIEGAIGADLERIKDSVGCG